MLITPRNELLQQNQYFIKIIHRTIMIDEIQKVCYNQHEAEAKQA